VRRGKKPYNGGGLTLKKNLHRKGPGSGKKIKSGRTPRGRIIRFMEKPERGGEKKNPGCPARWGPRRLERRDFLKYPRGQGRGP